MGKCKATKKDGNPCTAIVNTSSTQYCKYHLLPAYNKLMMKEKRSSAPTRLQLSMQTNPRVPGQAVPTQHNPTMSTARIPSIKKPQSKIAQLKSSVGGRNLMVATRQLDIPSGVMYVPPMYTKNTFNSNTGPKAIPNSASNKNAPPSNLAGLLNGVNALISLIDLFRFYTT